MADDVNISGIHFDNNMPKWATEDTLKKLKDMLKVNSNLSSKQQQKIVTLLGYISRSQKTSEKSDKDMLTELRKITLSLRQLNSTISKSNSKTSTTTTNTTTKNNVVNTTKTNAEISSSLKKLLDNSNSSVQLLTKMNNTLMKTHMVLGNINSGVSSEAAKSSQKSGIRVTKIFNNKTKSSRKSSLKDAFKHQMDIESKGFDTLDQDIRNQKGGGASTEERIFGFSMTGKKKKREETKAKRISGIRSIKSALTDVTKFGNLLEGLAEKLPIIGEILVGLEAIAKLFEVAKSNLYDAQSQFTDLLDKGLSFAQERFNKNIQMDGIQLRKTITSAGITVEDGMKMLEHNAAMVNSVGFTNFFNIIHQLTAGSGPLGSFADRLMMTNKQMAEFTAEYLSSMTYAGTINSKNAKNQTMYIKEFTSSISDFSQITGEAREKLLKETTENLKNANTVIKMNMLQGQKNGGQRATNFKDIVAGVTGAFHNSEVGKALISAMSSRLSSAGFMAAGGPEAAKVQAALGQTYGAKATSQAMKIFNEITKKGGAGELTKKSFENLIFQFRDVLRKAKPSGVTTVPGANNEFSQIIASLQQIKTYSNASKKGTEEVKNSAQSIITKHLSDLQKEQMQFRNKVYKTKAAAEHAAAVLFSKKNVHEMATEMYKEANLGLGGANNIIAHAVTATMNFVKDIRDDFTSFVSYLKRIFTAIAHFMHIDISRPQKMSEATKKAKEFNKHKSPLHDMYKYTKETVENKKYHLAGANGKSFRESIPYSKVKPEIHQKKYVYNPNEAIPHSETQENNKKQTSNKNINNNNNQMSTETEPNSKEINNNNAENVVTNKELVEHLKTSNILLKSVENHLGQINKNTNKTATGVNKPKKPY